MKTIVISGAHSNVGKTSLAREICAIVPKAVHVKIGHGISKEDKVGILYHTGTPFEHISAQHKNAEFLIIESNRILSEITPDCAIYLSGESTKPSAVEAMQKADITRGTHIDTNTVKRLSQTLGLTETIIRKIAWLSGARPSAVSAIILAGGKSTRMGIDKALLEIEGESAVKRMHNFLSPYFDHIIVSVGAESSLSYPGIKVVRDIEREHGPLMGIYSALHASVTAFNFVIACDIPEVNMQLVSKLLACSEEYEISVPSFAEAQFEPLFAVYKKSVTGAAERLLRSHKRRIAELFSTCSTLIISSTGELWYKNLNTPKDYRHYLDITGKIAG